MIILKCLHHPESPENLNHFCHVSTSKGPKLFWASPTSHFLDDLYCFGNSLTVMFITIQKNWGVVDLAIQEFSLPSKKLGSSRHYHPRIFPSIQNHTLMIQKC